MKYLLAISILFSMLNATHATERVRTYHKKNGTVVQSHQRTSPNTTKRDNWSSKGNVNPYTGNKGTKKVDQ